MPSEDLTTRRDKILELIVENYIDTAEPVASRTISRKLRSGLSSATIRNVMADLEEIGLIMHPHTSAGRVPTEKGYRYYVDRLMQLKLLTEEEKRQITKEFKAKVNELDDILAKTSKILSSVTKQTGIVLFPTLKKSFLKHIELIRLDKTRLLTVLITRSNVTEEVIVDLNDPIEDGEIARITAFMNNQIDKGSLTTIRKIIMERLLVERDSFFYVLDKAKKIIDGMLDIIDTNKVYLGGRINMAEQPEFKDVSRLKDIFAVLEEEDIFIPLLQEEIEREGIKVYIGSELHDTLSGCSLITSRYCIGDAACGTLGVIGPMRMEYAKLISMVDYVALALNKVLS